MRLTLKKSNELITNRWAGGTTTQLAIFPADAEYQKFNFIFRISYATVEIPESTFTFMPGVTRHLMILEGKLQIDHTGRYAKELNPFDMDVFNGEWPTTARGTVKDFNLMTREGAEGKLQAIHLDASEKFQYKLQRINYSGLYLQNGSLTVGTEHYQLELETGDFLLIDLSGNDSQELNLTAREKSEIILSEVKL